MNKKIFILTILVLLVSMTFAQDSLSKRELRKPQKSFLLEDRKWTIEIPLWVPGFRGEFAYGDITVGGEDGGDPGDPGDPGDDDNDGIIGGIISKLFSSDFYVNFAFLSRFKYENKRWFAQADGFGGSVGESIKFNYNNKELVKATFRSINVRLFGGYLIYHHKSKSKKFQYKLYGYVGVRTHFQKIYSELNNATKNLDVNPVWAEPIIGIKNQFVFKRWLLVLQGDYGGYLNHTKHSTMLSAIVYYRTGRLTSLKFGWNHWKLRHRDEFLGETLKVDAMLSGPGVGLAFHF